jgi:hypothetical protein
MKIISYICITNRGRRVKRNSLIYQIGDVGAVPTSRSKFVLCFMFNLIDDFFMKKILAMFAIATSLVACSEATEEVVVEEVVVDSTTIGTTTDLEDSVVVEGVEASAE